MNATLHRRLNSRIMISILLAFALLLHHPREVYSENLPVTHIQNLGSQAGSQQYFHPAYQGNGVNHMNINFVNLQISGLKAGDQIGVFDGDLCVGSATIQDIDIRQNLFSVIASANDTLPISPNGYLPGHLVKLKAYCSGKLYSLYFDTVNGSKSTFIVGGTMFAFVDFKKSFEIGLLLMPGGRMSSQFADARIPSEGSQFLNYSNLHPLLVNSNKRPESCKILLHWENT